MTTPHHDEAIAASLRRQFSPPSLDALADRIAAEAAQRESEATRLPPPPEPAPRWPIALAVVLAAAAVLLLLRPESPPPPSPSVAAAPPRKDVPPPTESERTGRALHEFLTRGDTLPSPSDSRPPEVCGTDTDYPHLSEAAGGVLQLLGECGGTTDERCETFALPADRALLVQLDSGERIILSIERPWTDPAPELPVQSDLHRFRSELGDYVIYEITPLDHPAATKFLQL